MLYCELNKRAFGRISSFILLIECLFIVGSVGVKAQESASHPYKFQVKRDVPYTEGFLLDIYTPQGQGPFPTVVTFHGASGGKAAMDTMATALAEAGFVVFNAAWLTPHRPISAADALKSFQASECAVRFAGSKAGDYGGNTESVTIVGLSAGALSGAVVALAGSEFGGNCGAGGPMPVVNLFVGLEGQYVGATEYGGLTAAAKEQPELVKRLDPRSYIDDQEDLHIVLFLGDVFSIAVGPAETFYQALKEGGINCEIRHVSGPHKASTFVQGVVDLLTSSGQKGE